MPTVPHPPRQSGAATAPAATTPRLYRRSGGRIVGGVAGGLARHLGVDVVVVRAVFVALTAFGGAGALAYGIFWVFAPQDPTDEETPGERERALAGLVALVSLGVAALLLLHVVGLGFDPRVTIPLAVAAIGAVILWRQADDDARARWRQATATERIPGAFRAAGGILLVLLGAGAILIGPVDMNGTVGGLVATLVIAAGLGIVTGPVWLRMARDLAAERHARIREQERAELAAHVHDSVLHTLALIQRHVDDPRAVTRLARAQERELRSWLYRPRSDASLSAALERVAADVEDAHDVSIEAVVVGDCPIDESIAALRDATREALVNAAKYAGGAPITVYGEVEPQQVTVFVRDRGPGFDVDAIPEDRLGIRESVVGRMRRHGGSAVVRSTAGEGTEVLLALPRDERRAS